MSEHKGFQNKIFQSILRNKERVAYCISNTQYSYGDLANSIGLIQKTIRTNSFSQEKIIGLITNDDLETYSAIYACWLLGKAYVPINPDTPHDRMKSIINQAGIGIILDSNSKSTYSNKLGKTKVINIKDQSKDVKADMEIDPDIDKADLAYIFFTSGTTGTPKGVPISFENLSAFCDAFFSLDFNIVKEDRCLQMFDLTFDLSVMSFLIPVLVGASVYTIPIDEVKYNYIYRLLIEDKISFSLMVPSILYYLRPYFDEIFCPDLRVCLFCGEALPNDITKEWAKCVPNAAIKNVYGPTEDTIFCTEYSYIRKGKKNKTYNGVLSIGKEMKGVSTIIIDESNEEVKHGVKGELCLAGPQLTKGYWKNPLKNKETFLYLKKRGKKTRFYKTGDLCFKDIEGDIMYSGRVDFQAKIQGFRVELSEIEFFAKEVLRKFNLAAIAYKNNIGNSEIGLVLESDKIDIDPLLKHLRLQLPAYMIPSKIRFIEEFPLNKNGKTDRNKLSKIFINET